MIFVTVGSELPFDRLIRAVDEWAGRTGRDDVVAQIGCGAETPKHIDFVETLDPASYRDHCWGASTIIGHAGMGTILTALEMARPLLVMPRRAKFMETRNDHQVATAKHFTQSTHIVAAMDEIALTAALELVDDLPVPQRINSFASLDLLESVRAFISGAPMPSLQPSLTSERDVLPFEAPLTHLDQDLKVSSDSEHRRAA